MQSTPRIKALAGQFAQGSLLRAALAVLLVALLTACEPVGSLHALNDADDRNIVLEPKLLGTWDQFDSGKIESTWIFEQIDDEPAYRLTRRDADSGGTAAYRIVLVRLDGLLFLDAYPEAKEAHEEYGTHLLPLHAFHRIWVDDDTLRLAWLDDELLTKFLAERQSEVRHERFDSDPKILLTAPTEELQKFVVRHATEVFVAKPEDMLLFYRRENQARQRVLEEQLLLNPNDASLLSEIGQEHLQQGRYAEAREIFERAIKADPGQSSYRELLGTTWLFHGDPSEARKHFQAALQLGADSAQFGLGITYFLERRFSEAAQAFAVLVRQREHTYDTELLRWYLLSLEMTGNSQTTQDVLDKLGPASWEGELLNHLRGRLTEADLLRSARSPERVCEAEFVIGMQILAQGDRNAARAHFQKAAQSGAFGTLEYAAARAFL